MWGSSETLRARAARLRKSGERVCILCCRDLTDHDRGRFCSWCQEKEDDRHAERVREYICVKCGIGGVYNSGKKCCAACREKARVRAAERRRAARVGG
jgi:hypothetical protein